MQHKQQKDRAFEASLWWQSLQGSPAGTPAKDRWPANNTALARLRKAASPIDTMMEPMAMVLVEKIGGDLRRDKLLVIELAALLSHVRQNDTRPVATSLGGYDADSRVMHAARFHRLMQTERADRAVALRRAVRMLKGKANVLDIAYAWLVWDSKTLGENMRIDWMFRYVGASNNELPAAHNSDSSLLKHTDVSTQLETPPQQ